MRKLREEFKHEYNTELQLHLINFLVSDSDTFARCRRIIRDEYFDDQLSPTVRFILKHADSYHCLPDIDLIRAKTGIALKTFAREDVIRQNDWFFKEFPAFCQYRAMENAILDALDLLRNGEAGEVERRVKEAMTISLFTNLGTSYFENPEERLRRLIDKSQKVSTGFQEIDDLLYGGVGRGALNLFLGNSGMGKSLVLQNLALNWALAGYNGVYFSLELSEDEISLKMDAMITGRGTREIVRTIADSALLVAVKGKRAGQLMIKRLPENTTTTNDLLGYLKEYEISTGIRPDFIVVDYLDLLLPNNSRIDPSNLFVKDKFVSEEVRALMFTTNTFGATAGQFNRGSLETQGDFDHSHVSGGISKINTSDNVFGIWAPPHLKERGEFELKCLKARSSAALNKRVKLHYDPTSMRLSDLDGSTEMATPLSPDELRKRVASVGKPHGISTQVAAEPIASPKLDGLWSKARRKTDHL